MHEVQITLIYMHFIMASPSGRASKRSSDQSAVEIRHFLSFREFPTEANTVCRIESSVLKGKVQEYTCPQIPTYVYFNCTLFLQYPEAPNLFTNVRRPYRPNLDLSTEFAKSWVISLIGIAMVTAGIAIIFFNEVSFLKS